jgi:hypothetical protein
MRSNGQRSQLHFGSVGLNFDIRHVSSMNPYASRPGSDVYDRKPIMTRVHADAMVKFDIDPQPTNNYIFLLLGLMRQTQWKPIL